MAYTTKSSITSYLMHSPHNAEIVQLFKKMHEKIKGKDRLPYEVLESKVRKEFLEGRLMPYQMTPEKFEFEFRRLKEHVGEDKVPKEIARVEVLVDEMLGTVGYRHKNSILTLQEFRVNEGSGLPDWNIASLCGGWERIVKNPYVPFQVMVNNKQANVVQTARYLKVGVFVNKDCFSPDSLAKYSFRIDMYHGYDKYNEDYYMVSLENLGKAGRTIGDPQIVLLEIFNSYWNRGDFPIGMAVKKAKIKVELAEDFPFKRTNGNGN